MLQFQVEINDPSGTMFHHLLCEYTDKSRDHYCPTVIHQALPAFILP